MGLFEAGVNIDDKDLLLIESIVKRVCRSLDGMSAAVTRVAEAVEKKKLELK